MALAAQLQAEGFDPAKMRLPLEQWYPAADGLKTVRERHTCAHRAKELTDILEGVVG